MRSSLLRFDLYAKLAVAFFFVVFFLMVHFSHLRIRSTLSALTKEEVKDLDYFLELLLFENHGVFVLFGSKPMSTMTLIDTQKAEQLWEDKLAALSQSEKDHWEKTYKKMKEKGAIQKKKFKRNPYNGWKAWCKIQPQLHRKKYLIVLSSQGKESAFYNLSFLDLAQVSDVLAQNYELFEKITGLNFDPLEKSYEIVNSDSFFWKKVFTTENHLLKGLLFGYGDTNSALYNSTIRPGNQPLFTNRKDINRREIELGCGNKYNFNIPRFRAVTESEIADYQRQKKKIRSKYRGRKSLYVSLKKLDLEENKNVGD